MSQPATCDPLSMGVPTTQTEDLNFPGWKNLREPNFFIS